MAIDNLVRDLRYTFRTLRRDAGFTIFAILIAGLGIGASATVFSVVNTLLLRPLPFTDPERLVWIANRDTSGLSGQTTQVGHMLDLRERTQSLAAVAGYFAFYGVGDNVLTGAGEPEPAGAPRVAHRSARGTARRLKNPRNFSVRRVDNSAFCLFERQNKSHPRRRGIARNFL
jgi:hypothetical protein